jgi:hypothetical protein
MLLNRIDLPLEWPVQSEGARGKHTESAQRQAYCVFAQFLRAWDVGFLVQRVRLLHIVSPLPTDFRPVLSEISNSHIVIVQRAEHAQCSKVADSLHTPESWHAQLVSTITALPISSGSHRQYVLV